MKYTAQTIASENCYRILSSDNCVYRAFSGLREAQAEYEEFQSAGISCRLVGPKQTFIRRFAKWLLG